MPKLWQEVQACWQRWKDIAAGSSCQGGRDSGQSIWHSERATLSSGLAALGVEKSDRDFLGHWCPEGSDVYVRTYNSIVKKMQRKFAATLQGESVPEDMAETVADAWKEKIGVKGLPRPVVQVSEDVATIYSGAPSEGDAEETGQHEKKKKKKKKKKKRVVQGLDEEREGNYVVVYRRAGRGSSRRLAQRSGYSIIREVRDPR